MASNAAKEPRTAEEIETLLSPEEVAAILGVPVATIYKWRVRNTGPAGFRVGKYLRFRPRDVRRWIDQQPRSEARSRSRASA